MEDRSFEEQVRAELEALRLKPEAQVWEQVEAAIRRQNRRRWLLWPLVILAIGGCIGIYTLLMDTTAGPTPVISKNRTTTGMANNKTGDKQILHAPPPIQNSISNTPPKVEVPDQSSQSIEDAAQQLNQSAVAKEVPSVSKINHAWAKTRQYGPSNPAGEMHSDKMNTADVVTKTPVKKSGSTGMDPLTNPSALSSDMIPQTKIAEAGTDQSIVSVDRENMQRGKQSPDQPTIKTDSSQSIAQGIKDSAVAPTAEAVIITKNEKARKAWQWLIIPSIGISGERNSFTNGGLAYASIPPNVGNGQASAGGSIYKTPSQTNAGSFGLQLQALRSAGKNGSIGVSVGYSSYASVMGVGRKVDTMMSGSFGNRADRNDGGIAYISSDSTKYTNRYHFAELNLDYYRNIRIGSKGLLRWHIGTGMALLLGTNTLHYNASSGLLFRNRSLMPTLQTNLATGMDMALGRSRSFYIGPRLTYFLSTTSQVSTTSRHLFNAALRIGVVVPKKKR